MSLKHETLLAKSNFLKKEETRAVFNRELARKIGDLKLEKKLREAEPLDGDIGARCAAVYQKLLSMLEEIGATSADTLLSQGEYYESCAIAHALQATSADGVLSEKLAVLRDQYPKSADALEEWLGINVKI